ncbi:hypothetical protein ACU5JM_09235 [Rhodococcus erythropolis]|uniref:hypothetical protein n=1 Tax=Rhodococcus erythropolis TaxID=1833 RepID=UPI00406BC597
MNTTPLWVPLVVAGLGLVGTVVGAISGVLITQRRSDRREDASWEREWERERERWAREDAARTFEHRRDAYADFYQSLHSMTLRAYCHGMGLSDYDGDELPEGWQSHTFERLQHLKLYAAPKVRLLASEAYSTAWTWGHATKNGLDDGEFYDHHDQADEAEAKLLAAIREDLRVPER